VFTLGKSKWLAEEDEMDVAFRLVQAIRSGRYETQQDAGLFIGIKDKTKVSRVLRCAKTEGLIKAAEIKECLEACEADFDEEL
jgi:hypothetical protein